MQFSERAILSGRKRLQRAKGEPMRLVGAQRLVLQTILDVQGDSANYVADAKVAEITQIALSHVRDWFQTLSDEGLISLARTSSGFSANIEAKGRLALNQARPFTDSPSSPSATTSSALRASAHIE